MGGTVETMAILSAVSGAVGTVAGMQGANAQAKAQAQQADLQRRAQELQRTRQLKQVEEDRKVQLARVRAGLGAAGLGGSGGSSAAILAGLNRRADEDRADLLRGFGVADEALALSAAARRKSGLSQFQDLLELGQDLGRVGSQLSDPLQLAATTPRRSAR